MKKNFVLIEQDEEFITLQSVLPEDNIQLDWMRKASDLLLDAERSLSRWPESLQSSEKFHQRIALATSLIRLAECWPKNVQY